MKMLLKPTPVPVFIQQTRAKPYESLNARGQIENEPAYISIYKKKKSLGFRLTNKTMNTFALTFL